MPGYGKLTAVGNVLLIVWLINSTLAWIFVPLVYISNIAWSNAALTWFCNVILLIKIFKKNLYLYEQELEDRKEIASERFTDKTIYRFYNESLQVCFFGLRKDFIKEYNLSKGNVSSLINKKLKTYKKWVIL